MLAQLLTGGFLLLVSSPQVGRLWTFNELTSASDLVLVAKVVETHDTGRTTIHPGLRPDLPVVEMETELRVLTIRKGGGSSISRLPTSLLRDAL